jgi:hypothetical protein
MALCKKTRPRSRGGYGALVVSARRGGVRLGDRGGRAARPVAGALLGTGQFVGGDRHQHLVELRVGQALPPGQSAPHGGAFEIDLDAFASRQQLGIAVLRHGVAGALAARAYQVVAAARSCATFSPR